MEPTLYAINDGLRRPPSLSPFQDRLNSSANRWNLPGQWIKWRFEVPESGLYKIVFKARQSTVRGSYCNRRILINGEVPFAEADNLEFRYSSSWKNYTVTNAKGEPCLFYLEKGENELHMEYPGALADLLRAVEDLIFQLNKAYRKDPDGNLGQSGSLPRLSIAYSDTGCGTSGRTRRIHSDLPTNSGLHRRTRDPDSDLTQMGFN